MDIYHKTVSGIEFITPAMVGNTISFFEDHLPGWWYSISQSVIISKEGSRPNLRISCGPSLTCPLIPSRIYAVTKEGDAGHRFDLRPSDFDEDALDHIRVLLVEYQNARLRWGDKPDRSWDSTGDPRIHSGDELPAIESSYIRMVDAISKVELYGPETGNTTFLTEVYLGSCATSADCSIRGVFQKEGEFDFSCDIQDVDSFHISIDECVDKLKTSCNIPG